MSELAPGVIGVHTHEEDPPWYAPRGERWGAYFDMSRWQVKDPEKWGPVGVTSRKMKGIGVISGSHLTLRTIRRFAERNLVSSSGRLGWYAEPREISPAELGGIAMVMQADILRARQREREEHEVKIARLLGGIYIL